MKIEFIITFFLLSIIPCKSQDFEEIIIDTPNSDKLNSFVIDSNNSIVILGTRDNKDPFLIKTDLDGNIIWDKLLDSYDKITGSSIIEAEDGGYLILNVIWLDPFPEINMQLVKTNYDGEIEWIRVIDNHLTDYGFDIKKGQNSYMICGYAREPNSRSNTYLLDIDYNGNVNWEYVLDDHIEGTDVQIIQTEGNDWVMCGFGHNSINGSNFHAAKVNEDGELIWSEFYQFCEEGFSSYLSSLTESNDNGYILSGRATKCDSEDFQQVLIKIDTNGELVWEHKFGEEFIDRGGDLTTLNDEILVLGHSYKDSLSNVSTIKSYDQDGNLNWENEFPFENVSNPKLIRTKGNSVFVMGNIIDGDQFERDFFLIKWQQDYLSSTNPYSDNDNNINIYPNPFTKYFIVNLNSRENKDDINIQIFDNSGKKVESSYIWLSDMQLQVEVNSNETLGYYYYVISNKNDAHLKSGKLIMK